jgi:ketosteroid isomerase-like protein
MSQENVATLEHGFDAFNSGDLKTFFECFHPNVVYRDRADEPDAREYHGLEEFKGCVQRWLDAFDDLRFQVHEWIDLGDRVIEVTELHGRGNATGATVRGTYVFLWTFRDGLIIDGREYTTREEALEAADRQSETRS